VVGSAKWFRYQLLPNLFTFKQQNKSVITTKHSYASGVAGESSKWIKQTFRCWSSETNLFHHSRLEKDCSLILWPTCTEKGGLLPVFFWLIRSKCAIALFSKETRWHQWAEAGHRSTKWELVKKSLSCESLTIECEKRLILAGLRWMEYKLWVISQLKVCNTWKGENPLVYLLQTWRFEDLRKPRGSLANKNSNSVSQASTLFIKVVMTTFAILFKLELDNKLQ